MLTIILEEASPEVAALIHQMQEADEIQVKDHDKTILRLGPLPVSLDERITAMIKLGSLIPPSAPRSPLPPPLDNLGGKPLSEYIIEDRENSRY